MASLRGVAVDPLRASGRRVQHITTRARTPPSPVVAEYWKFTVTCNMIFRVIPCQTFIFGIYTVQYPTFLR